MTRAEFDAWIEQHYGDLLKVARARTNSDEDAHDALQNMLAGALANETYTRLQHKPWTYFSNALRGYADAIRKSGMSRRRLRQEQTAIARASFSLGRKRPAPRAE